MQIKDFRIGCSPRQRYISYMVCSCVFVSIVFGCGVHRRAAFTFCSGKLCYGKNFGGRQQPKCDLNVYTHIYIYLLWLALAKPILINYWQNRFALQQHTQERTMTRGTHSTHSAQHNHIYTNPHTDTHTEPEKWKLFSLRLRGQRRTCASNSVRYIRQHHIKCIEHIV